MQEIAAGERRVDLKMLHGSGVAMLLQAVDEPCANTGNALASPEVHPVFFAKELDELTFVQI